MSDLISRADALEAIKLLSVQLDAETVQRCIEAVSNLPSAQPKINGYDIRHLELIAAVLQKENLPPEIVAEVLTDIGRIVAIVTEEFEEALRKAVEQCTTC